MRKNIFKIIFLVFFTLTFCLSSNAKINDDGDYEVNVDKFIPSKGMKVKESNLASRMENATKNAAYGNKKNKSMVRKRTKQTKNKTQGRSYKWF